MPRGKLITKEYTRKEKLLKDFPVVDDLKMRMTLIGMADKYNEQVREIIMKSYNDPQLMSLYRGIRASGIYQHGSKSKVRRKIVEFPNGHVYDFVDTVMTSIYGIDWLNDKRALRHELVRPWWVVNGL